MSADHALLQVIIFLAAIAFVVPVARRLNLAPILGYLAAGLAIGPYGFALVQDSHVIHWLAELGVVFLLFAVGLELSLTRLRTIPPAVLALGLLQIFVTLGVIAAGLWLIGTDPVTALILGAGFCLSSTALVALMLSERGEIFLRFGRIAIAILLVQDLAVVPFVIAVQMVGGDGAMSANLWVDLAAAAAALLAIVLAGRLLVPRVLRVVAQGRSTEVMIAATLVIVLGVSWLADAVGLSMILGAFLAGVLLADTEYRHSIEADVEPVRGILMAVFFVSVGMRVDPGPALAEPLIFVLGILTLLAVKAALIFVLARLTGVTGGLAMRLGFTLSQAGEFGFILFGLALSLGVLPGPVAQFAILTIAATMAVTPFLDQLGQRLGGDLDRRLEPGLDDLETETADLSDHVIVAGFGRVGHTVTQLLADQKIPVIALDVDASDVRLARQRGQPVYFGDAMRPDVLRAVGAERARAIVVTLDRTHTCLLYTSPSPRD